MELDKATTALVVIDLQKGIVSVDTAPHPTKAVVANAALLAKAFRERLMPVFLVRVGFSPDGKDALKPLLDPPSASPYRRDAGWSEIVPELGPEPTDHIITKHQWGAFHGTELDLQLRRRGIQTIVLCGISTSLGVESTARFAFELGYQQVFVEDAMSARSQEEHDHTLKFIFPRLGRVWKTQDIIGSLT